jgi:hypothetical protein
MINELPIIPDHVIKERQANSCRLFTSEYAKQGSTANESSKASSEEKTDDELQISTKIIGFIRGSTFNGISRW